MASETSRSRSNSHGAVLLILFAVVVFLVGLVSEQVSSLRFGGRRGNRQAMPVVINPTHRRDNLPVIVDALRIPDMEVLVVDDRSPDGTGEADALASSTHGRVSVLAPARPRGFGCRHRWHAAS
jgi:hypothetical protein